MSCVMLNLSIPGTGTLKAGRMISGVGQLVTVFAGFFLLLAWMLEWIYRIFQSQIGDSLPPVPAAWLWKSGVAGFLISWTWTAVTCVSLLRQAKKDRAAPRNVPPKLS